MIQGAFQMNGGAVAAGMGGGNASGAADPAPSGASGAPRAASALGAALSQQDAAERRAALRALLLTPLLSAAGPTAAEYALVRRHVAALRDWFSRTAGWVLVVDSECARLRKIAAVLTDSTRGAVDESSGSVFSRRRYVLFCLALAALERSDRQITLDLLARNIVQFVGIDPTLAAQTPFELELSDHRRDLVHAVRLLLFWRVLVRVQGEEQQYLNKSGDVLYNVNRWALAAMLVVKRAPSGIDAHDLSDRLAAITEEPIPDSDEGRNRQMRMHLFRRLLDDPAVYAADLTDAQRAYFTSQRASLVRQIEEATGLLPEIRREGVAMVDEAGELTDLRMPEEGTDGHVTLLVAEFLADHLRRLAHGAVAMEAVERHVQNLIIKHRAHWRNDAALPGAQLYLAAQAVLRLAALHLVRCTPDGVVPLPAVARYAAGEARPGRRGHANTMDVGNAPQARNALFSGAKS